MEDLIPALVIIIGVVAKIISSSNKEKAKKAEDARRFAAAASRVQNTQQTTAPARPVQPAAQPIVQTPVVQAPVIPAQVAQPQVHVHLQPDCDTHDAAGSLGVTSTEGKDPCHENELTYDRSFTEEPVQEGGLTFDWTGSSMVKAFVMQEVLTRPAQRRAR